MYNCVLILRKRGTPAGSFISGRQENEHPLKQHRKSLSQSASLLQLVSAQPILAISPNTGGQTSCDISVGSSDW